MRKIIFAASLVMVLVMVSSLVCAEEFRTRKVDVRDRSGAVYAQNEVIVKFKDTSRAFLAAGTSRISTSRRGGFVRLRVSKDIDIEELVEMYRTSPAVEYAEPNYIYRALMTPNDTYYSYQWHLPAINCGSGWDISTGSGVLLGIIDTGVAYEDYGSFQVAPDLAGTSFVAGYDFVNNDYHANDDNSHGTHVAGTVAQTTNNSMGCAGVAFDCTIMPIKVLDSEGSGYVSDIADGIYYAADNGCRVINMSLGGNIGSTTLQNAVQYAYNAGVTIVCAAGNAGTSTPQYPAAYPECISVSAVRYDNTITDYSSYGSTIDICAPGGDVSVDQNGDGYGDGVLQQTFAQGYPTDFGYYFYEGTSMASPHVAGAAAVVIAAAGGSLSPSEVRSILEGTATDLGATGWDQYYGHGKVDVYAAALEAQGGGAEYPPIADFTGSPTTGDAPLAVYFTDQSTNDPVSWNWDFGDGGTSTAQNPTHQYADPGTYTVSLTVSNAYGSDSETKSGYITVTAPSDDRMHVADIYVSRSTWWILGRGRATVRIVDQNGYAVSGATVYGNFTGPASGGYSGSTNSSGEVTFTTGWVWGPSGEWCFEVTDVTLSGWTYEQAANVVTKSCESGDVYEVSKEEMMAGGDMPAVHQLFQNYPNPFNPATTIAFSLPVSGRVRLEIFNVKGELVETLVDRELEAGVHRFDWNASGVSSGVYFCRMLAGDFVQTRKMLLLR